MKKGFTLIELLAVIVILAIIATIATPIVLSIIEDTKESATLRNAEYYLEAVEQSIVRKSMNTGSNYKPNTCVIQSDGNLLCDEEVIIEVEVKGKKPSGGTITFDKGTINDVSLNIENKVVTQNEKGEFKINPGSGLYDANGKLIADWNTLVTIYGMDVEKNYTYSTYKTDSSSPYYVFTNNSEFSTGVKLIILEDVTKIGDYAFAYTALTSVTIPEGVTTIGSHAFYYTPLTSIIIPEGVTTIGNYAFSYTDLTSITIPNGVTAIEDNLFYVSKLTSVTIPEGVTTIGSHAFYYTPLTSIIIPEGVTTIEDSAFYHCDKLTSMEIPGSVTSIGKEALYGLGKLSDMTFNGTVEQGSAIVKNLYTSVVLKMKCTNGTVEIPIKHPSSISVPFD